MKPLTLLIDADYFLYRACNTAEDELEFDFETTVVVGDFRKGQQIFRQSIKDFQTKFDSDKVLLTFTDSKNFRKDVEPTYKGNRVKRKPCGYKKLKNWAMKEWPSVMKPGLEADDVMGILATNGSLENFILISPDKDMAQIPVRIYDLKTEYTQTPEKAHELVYIQTLTGDSTDGYSGCPGIGPKRALAILGKVKDGNYWPAVVDTYKEAGLEEADAIRNLRLANILKAEHWDSEAQQPILITS